MTRFESPLQVLGVFVLATIVSIGLIFLINSEAENRREREASHHHQVVAEIHGIDSGGKNGTGWFLGYMRRVLRLGETDSERKRRSVLESSEEVKMRHQHKHKALEVSISSTKTRDEVCYGTDDVLIVVGITCCLNFAFVLAVWAMVRWGRQGSGNSGGWGSNKDFNYRGWGDYSEEESETDEDLLYHDEKKRKCQSMEELRYVT